MANNHTRSSGGMTDTEAISTSQRLISACSGSLITSLFVTPLDVIKVRLQAHTPLNVEEVVPVKQDLRSVISDNSSTRRKWWAKMPMSPTSVKSCTHFEFSNGLMGHMCPKSSCPAFNPAKSINPLSLYPVQPSTVPTPPVGGVPSSFQVATNIIRTEGVSALWTGLPATLIMAVPATMLYFTAYEELRIWSQSRMENTWLPPLLAGGSARCLAATVVSPLELFRTQLQAVKGAHSSDYILKNLIQQAQSGPRGISSLWRGLTPTLLRDVPFSMMYWLGYETLKKWADVSQCETHSEYILKSFGAGLISGTVSAAVTTPFDVVKTRVQVHLYSAQPSSVSPMQMAREIYRTEGWRGMFVGIVPRMSRIAPSCAIMISSYELGKKYFAS